MSRKKQINDPLVAKLYGQGLTLSALAEMFDVTEVAVHYALKRQGVERNRLNNPMQHSKSEAAIKSRVHRYQEELDEALESGDKAAIREASEKVLRERRNLAQIRAARRGTFDGKEA